MEKSTSVGRLSPRSVAGVDGQREERVRRLLAALGGAQDSIEHLRLVTGSSYLVVKAQALRVLIVREVLRQVE